jgi:SAM-dependent methyltransferase
VFQELEKINSRPEPFQFYTTEDLWTDEHTSKKMLEYHLNESVDAASRKKEFIEHSVEWITSHFNVNNQTDIIDFGCGPGLYTTKLAEKGARVTGIDFSKRSIDYAKETAIEKGLKINYLLNNYLTFKTDLKFDLITMIMCDFCVLSPKQRQEIIQKFYKLLKPDGTILLDVYTLEAFESITEKSIYEINQLDGFWSPEKYFGFVNTFKYFKEKVILDKYTIIEQNRIREIYNWLQYYSVESIKAEFEKNKLRIVSMYSDVAGSVFDPNSKEMAMVIKKY